MPKFDVKNKKQISREIGSNMFIFVVKGKVKNSNYSPEIKVTKIQKKFFKTKSNNSGNFKINLKPGTYTFFIKKNNTLYLNKFDEFGFFQSEKISKIDNKVKLIFNKNLLR